MAATRGRVGGCPFVDGAAARGGCPSHLQYALRSSARRRLPGGSCPWGAAEAVLDARTASLGTETGRVWGNAGVSAQEPALHLT